MPLQVPLTGPAGGDAASQVLASVLFSDLECSPRVSPYIPDSGVHLCFSSSPRGAATFRRPWLLRPRDTALTLQQSRPWVPLFSAHLSRKPVVPVMQKVRFLLEIQVPPQADILSIRTCRVHFLSPRLAPAAPVWPLQHSGTRQGLPLCSLSRRGSWLHTG